MIDPWNNPASYDPTVADRHMGVIMKARRSMIHPKVEAEWDDARALQREQELEIADEPSGVWGWIITGLCVFVMGFAIAVQI